MKNALVLLTILFCAATLFAQQNREIDNLAEPRVYDAKYNLVSSSTDDVYGYKPKMNLFKVNLLGLPIRTFSFQYERVINKVISVGISYRNMPEGNLPFKNQIINSMGDSDIETENTIREFKIANYAITPEVRFYLGKKGYGRGFYIAPFYMNAGYKASNFNIHYEDEFNNKQSLALSGDIKSNTFGILFGAQWSLSKYVVLDWWILGPHIGKSKGNLTGIATPPLSPDAQANIRQILEDFQIPFVDKEVTVNSQGAVLGLGGKWAGLRAGLALGVKF